MKKIVISCLAMWILACSQNAHLTRPDLAAENSGLSQKPSDKIAPAKTKIVLEDNDQKTILFSGSFVAEGKLSEVEPAEVDGSSIYRWSQLAKYFKGRIEGDLTQIEFEKIVWAKESGERYRLFDVAENLVLPENQRGKARAVKLTVTQTLPNQAPQLHTHLYPVQYRYVIDDEALNQGQVGNKNDAYYAKGLMPGRYVRGLEYVSNRKLLYRNINCHGGYDFIDTYVYNGRYNFKARVIARRDGGGTWNSFLQPYSTLLGAVGFGLTNKRAAYFSDILAYGGNCTFKVQGLMSVDVLNSEVLDGLRVELIAQTGEKGFADFGVTVLEAY